MTWLVLLNRNAGRKPVAASDVRDLLRSVGADFELEVPASRSETIEIVREALQRGTERFCVAGGDGTVNLVADTILKSGLETAPTLGILPTGTGCDLLRTFGITPDLGEAASHLVTEDTYPIDVVHLKGSWGTRFFVNVGQTGVGAAAAETAPRLSRRMGPVRYPLAFGARLPRFPITDVEVVTEKRTYSSRALAVIFANAQFFAGGWNIAPRATLVDGVADIQIFNAKKSQAPALVPKIIKGTHLSDPAVRRFSAGEFTITTQADWPIEVDGDYIGTTPVTGQVVPAAIQLKI